MMKKLSSALLPRLPLWAGLLAVVLTLPALKAGLFMDDYGMLLTVRGDSEIYSYTAMSPMDLFSFFDGQPENSHKCMDLGFFPWWSDLKIKARFWRPLTSLTHFLEFRFCDEHVWFMHLNNILIYGVLAGLAAILYRRWLSVPWVVVLAAIFFAADHTNATPALWIANRNVVLAAVFGFLALWAHDRWRRDSWNAGPFVAVGAFALSLLSCEAGIATCAYFFAHAAFLDREKLPKALLCLVPYAVTVVAWRIAWTMQGYGTAAIGLYTDPLNEPLGFLYALGERFPILFLSQWALPPANTATFLGPVGKRFHLLAALGFVAVVAALFWPVLRRNRTAGFFLTGMLLSLVPICAAFPSDRMLYFVGLGAMGLIAEIVREAREEPSHLWPKKAIRVPALALAGLLLVVHLVISPALLVVRTAYGFAPKGTIEYLALLHAPLGEDAKDQDFIFLNPLEPGVTTAGMIMREAKNMIRPRSMRALAPGKDGVTLQRVDKNTLLLRPRGGFFAGFFNSIMTHRDRRMNVGDRVELRGMTVEVMEVDAKGHPLEARFIFDVELEDPSLELLQWGNDGYIDDYSRFEPPPIGTTVEL
jgi:hypothetical protein